MSSNPTPVIAAFDLDGTLSEGGSVFKWLRFLRGTRATYFAALTLFWPLVVGAVRSGPWADEAKERLFQRLLTGLDASDVKDRSRVFAFAHFEENARASVIERLKWHLRQGHDVVIVSASPQIYVDVVGEALDAVAGLGTRLSIDARNQLTGSYLGKNCRGKEKMRRLNEWISERHLDREVTIYAYGNSRGDRRMLRGATHPYNVGKLGAMGALRHFPQLKNEEMTSKTTVDE